MKKPTKAQRHAIYTAALKRMESDLAKGWITFICPHIETVCFDMFGKFPQVGEVHKLFPELHEKKPKRADHAWWRTDKSGNTKRFAAIRKCIRETAPTHRK